MVKVSGPMFSLTASGTLADTVTFSHWKGRPYARARVIPSNPKSGPQVGRRAMFKFLSQIWDAIPAADKASWQTIADQLIASPFNAFTSENMKGWHNFLAPSTCTPPLRVWLSSDNALVSADWIQNQIRLAVSGTALNNTWGLIIYGALGAAVTPSVGNAITVELDDDIALHYYYWTPPTVAEYTFDSMTFSADGKIAVPGGPQTATPP